MVVVWLFDIATTVLGWFLGLFSALPALTLPASLAVSVPVPVIGAAGVSVLNQWWPIAVAVSLALVVGKVLQWIYKMIPFKMT